MFTHTALLEKDEPVLSFVFGESHGLGRGPRRKNPWPTDVTESPLSTEAYKPGMPVIRTADFMAVFSSSLSRVTSVYHLRVQAISAMRDHLGCLIYPSERFLEACTFPAVLVGDPAMLTPSRGLSKNARVQRGLVPRRSEEKSLGTTADSYVRV